ncbi:hypothetical protein [Thalassotalea castellviae]|uniref:Uncharacterized protein n=1 Tax=Thalassotalea castellviae TaxID=3075612 RepID=A0ABU3A3D3_9GAMM|nr:hypothetical protein [Thalassotalea sp. W431]MDT0603481.1 hypothetical protein [Thalassotalea sp. W431]
MVRINFIEKMLLFMGVIITLLLQSCTATNYQFGDITKRIDNLSMNYCTATNPETRAMLKFTLNSLGVNIGIDYCTAYGLKTIVVGGDNG